MGKENKQVRSPLEGKIFDVLKELQEMPVLDLSRFDVKDGQDGEVYYHKTYVDKAQKAMEGCGGLSQNWCDMSPWQKMCVYKVSDEDGVDCDVALRSVVIYWLALYKNDEGWEIREQPDEGRKKGKPGYYELVSKQGEILRGDTMNSYATTVHAKLNMLPDTPENKEIMKAKGIITGEKTGKGKYYLADKYPKKPWNAAALEHYEYFKKILSSDFGKLEMFVSLVHTLGNFIPVPFKSREEGEFNSPRGTSTSQDYWDLALLCIYNYYTYTTGKSNDLKKWILKNSDNNVALCTEWLDGFGKGPNGWKCFVEQNFLQDFVNQENDGYGRPKALWNGHFENQGNKPSGEQFSEFFTNASAWILARGVRIALAVKDQLTDLPEEKLKELARRMAGEEGK